MAACGAPRQATRSLCSPATRPGDGFHSQPSPIRRPPSAPRARGLETLDTFLVHDRSTVPDPTSPVRAARARLYPPTPTVPRTPISRSPPHTHTCEGETLKRTTYPPLRIIPPPLCEMRESEVQGVLRTHSLWCTVYRTVYIRNLRLYTRGALYGLLKPWNLPGTVIPNFVQVDLKKL